MVRKLWKRIEPWLTRAGHFDLLFVKTGLGGLIVTGAAGLVISALAWGHRAPLYQVVLAGMVAMALALFMVNQSLRLITNWKLPATVSRQQARRLDRHNPGGAKLGGSAAIVVTILASSLIVVGGLYGADTYSKWHDDIESTYLSIVPGQVQIDPSNKDHPLVIHYTIVNPGALPVNDPEKNEGFAYPRKQLTSEEEDNYFRILDASVAQPQSGAGLTIFAHSSDLFAQAEDQRFTPNQWNLFQDDDMKIYWFLEQKYFVSGYVKVSEDCLYYQKSDFPSAHVCHKHRGWRWE